MSQSAPITGAGTQAPTAQESTAPPERDPGLVALQMLGNRLASEASEILPSFPQQWTLSVAASKLYSLDQQRRTLGTLIVNSVAYQYPELHKGDLSSGSPFRKVFELFRIPEIKGDLPPVIHYELAVWTGWFRDHIVVFVKKIPDSIFRYPAREFACQLIDLYDENRESQNAEAGLEQLAEFVCKLAYYGQ